MAPARVPRAMGFAGAKSLSVGCFTLTGASGRLYRLETHVVPLASEPRPVIPPPCRWSPTITEVPRTPRVHPQPAGPLAEPQATSALLQPVCTDPRQSWRESRQQV